MPISFLSPRQLPPKGAKETVVKHSQSLIRYLENLFARIFESVERCPHIMRLVFKHLQESVREVRPVTISLSDTICTH